MFSIEGLEADHIVVSDGWVEKVRGGQSVMKKPLTSFKGLEVKEVTRKTKLFGGVKEQRLELLVDVGTFMTLTVPVAKRDDVERLREALQGAGS